MRHKRIQKIKILVWFSILLLTLIGLSACSFMQSGSASEGMEIVQAQYHSITPQEAKERIDGHQVASILDVRTEMEYRLGHLTGSVLIPEEEVREGIQSRLPDKDAVVIVYCQNGSRSRQCAMKLVSLGYSNVYDLGGITDWPYEIEK